MKTIAIKFETIKSFNVCYDGIRETHTCGQIKTKCGEIVGFYSGNIFDGYRCIIKVRNNRVYIGGSTFLHLMRQAWKSVNVGIA